MTKVILNIYCVVIIACVSNPRRHFASLLEDMKNNIYENGGRCA